MAYKQTLPVSNIRYELKTNKAGNSAGFSPNRISLAELSPRRKRCLFRQTMLWSAKKALAAGSISAANYALILKLYNKPWRKTTATGAIVDVLDLVRNYMSGISQSKYQDSNLAGVYITDWWGQNIRAVGQTKLLARDWLATAGIMLGANGLGNAAGLIYAIGACTPA